MAKNYISKVAFPAILVAGALALVGCSGGNASEPGGSNNAVSSTGDQAVVFDFSMDAPAPAKKLEIHLPEELIAAAGDKGAAVSVASFTATAHPLEGAEYCGIDLGINYKEGGLEALKSEGSKTPFENFGNGVFSTAYPSSAVEIASEFDAADPSPGVYVSDDFSSAIVIQDCAISLYDVDEDAVRYGFTAPNESYGLAGFSLAVMKDGQLGVPRSAVSGFVQDANGDWIVD